MGTIYFSASGAGCQLFRRRLAFNRVAVEMTACALKRPTVDTAAAFG
jgi:hypothetical protein